MALSKLVQVIVSITQNYITSEIQSIKYSIKVQNLSKGVMIINAV